MNLETRHRVGPPEYVRLQKIGATANPDHRSGDPTTYPVGAFDDIVESLPLGYYLEGWLLKKPVVGDRVEVLRVSRNGVARLGYFTSSKVVEIEVGGFRTRNSIYLLTILPTSNRECSHTTEKE